MEREIVLREKETLFLLCLISATNVAVVGDCIHCSYRHEWAGLISELTGRELNRDVRV